MRARRLLAMIGTILIPAMIGAQGAQGRNPGGAGRGQNPNREATEQRVRERMASVIKNRLGLTDDQVTKLSETNRRFEERRRLLHDQERDIRMAMRDEMLLGEKANQAKVGDLLDRLLKVHRQRLDVVEQEQKELSTFLTPVQRVRFHALQDQMRRFRNEVQGRRGGPPAGRRRPDNRGPRNPGGPPGF